MPLFCSLFSYLSMPQFWTCCSTVSNLALHLSGVVVQWLRGCVATARLIEAGHSGGRCRRFLPPKIALTSQTKYYTLRSQRNGSRQDPNLPRLQPTLRLHCERAGILCSEGLHQRAGPLPGLPCATQDGAQFERHRKERERGR